MYFSIIIPTLNRPSDVKKMLDSILASSLLPSQIIIIDQSDNNATKKLITEMDIDIVDYHHFSIKSLTQAKNYGIQCVDKNSDLVFFFDDDISVNKDCFKNTAEYMNMNINKGTNICLLNMHTENRSINFIKKIGFFLLTGSCRFDEQFVTKSGFNAMLLYQPTIVKSIEWCGGGAMCIRHKIIMEGFSFPDKMLKYSLMEDVFFSYAIHRQYPDSLVYLPQAKIIHHESPTGRITNVSKMRQQVIHRFLFVKEFRLSYLGYLWTIFLLMGMDLLQYRSWDVISTYIQSLLYISKHHHSLTIHDGSRNAFIFPKS